VIRVYDAAGNIALQVTAQVIESLRLASTSRPVAQYEETRLARKDPRVISFDGEMRGVVGWLQQKANGASVSLDLSSASALNRPTLRTP